MGSTIAEKILGAHSGGKAVRAGEVVVARVDFAMIHDARAANALEMIARLGAKSLPFAARTAFVLDHYSPPPNAEAANTHVAMRAFADAHGSVLYDVGDGICHQVLPEGGHLTCGDLVVGTDTHSTTYGAFNAFGHRGRGHRRFRGADDRQAVVPRAGNDTRRIARPAPARRVGQGRDAPHAGASRRGRRQLSRARVPAARRSRPWTSTIA